MQVGMRQVKTLICIILRFFTVAISVPVDVQTKCLIVAYIYRGCQKMYTHFKRLLYRFGTAVAQLVEALRYKSEGRGFDSRWCHWNFSLT